MQSHISSLFNTPFVENLDAQAWQLLQDDLFLRWTLSPDEGTATYWEKWMGGDPDRIAAVHKAQEIIRDLSLLEAPRGAEQLSSGIWSGVQSRLAAQAFGTREANDLAPVIPIQAGTRRRQRRVLYWAAASIVILLAAGTVLRYYNGQIRPFSPQVASRLVDKELQRTNPTDAAREVLLVDGSKVILQPGATIRHAAFLQPDKREVYLEGNAFFDIAKDASRPFYVYTKDLVVHVLGTSFHVTTNKDNGDVTVLVQSGKISVSQKSNPARKQLILVSNQKVLYREQTQDLVQADEVPEKVAAYRPSAAAPIPFNFDETPVVEIFHSLESAYGIPMHFDPKTFASCTVTTSLADETFEEKLKIICVAINASYKIEGNQVFIDGKGCKE